MPGTFKESDIPCRQPASEPKPHPVLGEPSDSSLSKASPLSYQAAASSPLPPQAAHELKADLPPSCPNGSGCIATASLASQAVVYTTPLTAVPDYPQSAGAGCLHVYPPSPA